MDRKLWYKAPARDWLEALPLGSGRLAAMVLGGMKRERLALNHEWLWRGEHRSRDTEQRHHLLPQVRELLLAGNYEQGTHAGNEAFAGGGGVSGTAKRVDSYQPAADLYFEPNHGYAFDYRRELDLDTASVRVSYKAAPKRLLFYRDYVAHLTEDLIIARFGVLEGAFDAALWLDRALDPGCDLRVEAQPDRLVLKGAIDNGLDFQVEANVWHSGGDAAIADAGKLVITGTREILVAINIGTSMAPDGAAAECAAKRVSTRDWEELVATHVAEHSRHFGSISLHLPLAEPDLPTDERIRRLRGGEPDPALVLLYADYGRYLLVSSSANAQLPANLQGKWNEDIQAAWDADYHHDINLQMEYWLAEPTGMQKYTDALFQHMERMVPHGRKAAADLYGCRGVWFPIQTDPWGRCTPESYGWAVWIGAAPWLAQHMWWHYEYGLDEQFLRTRAYPFLKEVAAFYEDYLIEDDNGTLQLVPSQSPENRFTTSGTRFPVSICVSATMDLQLLWDTLTHAIRAAEILEVDADKRALWQDMLDRVPPMKIGSKGQLLEWNEEVEEVEPGHRHLSHLFGLFPGEQIGPERTPDLFQAAMRSLDIRLANFGGHTGWSRAWTACLFARAGEGDKAYEHVEHLITDFATDSLLDLHPPRVFQIDGNLGGAAAVVEMLLQSYHGEIHLLPALPGAWPEGTVSGLRARGGFTVDMTWADGQLTEATITSQHGQTCKVVDRDQRYTICAADGRPVPFRRDGHLLVVETSPTQSYRVKRHRRMSTCT